MLLKLTSVVIIVCIVLGVALADESFVPGDFESIQQAFDIIADGDTITVAVGIYHEALIAPPLSFVLRGDVEPGPGDYPRPVIDPTPVPGSDSLACFVLLPESHPIIEDFKFFNGSEMYPRRGNGDFGGVRSSSLDPVFRRCQFDSCYVGFYQEEEWDSQNTLLTFEGCRFLDDSAFCFGSNFCRMVLVDCLLSSRSVFLVNFYSNCRATRCRFQNNTSGYLLKAWGSNITVEDCFFLSQEHIFPAVRLRLISGRVGGNIFADCQSAWPLDIVVDGPGPIVVTGNEFFNNGPYESAQCGAGLAIGYYIDHVPLTEQAIVRNNVFHDLVSNVRPTALACGVPAVVDSNRFNELEPISTTAVSSTFLLPGDSAIFRDNLFWNTHYAMEAGGNTDARWNWWGHATGPYHQSRNPEGQGDEIVGSLQFEPWYIDSLGNVSVAENIPSLPKEYSLSVFPNPFNATTTLKLETPEAVILRVELFDIQGRIVRELWSGPVYGVREVEVDAHALPSGIYFARVTDVIRRTPIASEKIVLLK